MHGEKEVGGLKCGAVLAALGDYVDGALTPEEKARVEAHVSGCTHCERFGGSFAAMVDAVRVQLREPPTPQETARVMGNLDALLSRP
jgi:anti-sigma factor RsiW